MTPPTLSHNADSGLNASSSASSELSLAGSTIATPPSSGPKTRRKRPPELASRERLVLLSMMLVSGAVGAILYAHLEFSGVSASITGAAIFAACWAAHGQQRKQSEIARLKAEIARLEREPAADGDKLTAVGNGKINHSSPALGPAAPGAQSHGAPPSAASVPRWRQVNTEKPSPQNAVADEAAPLSLEPHARWEHPQTPPVVSEPARQAGNPGWSADAGPRAGSAIDRSAAPIAPPPAPVTAAPAPQAFDAALWPGTSLSTSDPMRDHWAFRPREAGMSPALGSTASSGGAASLPSTIDNDLATVQRKIKALADEVNAADALKVKPVSGFVAGPLAIDSTRMPPSVLDQSIGALKAAAGSMRERSAGPQQATPLAPATAQPMTLGDLPIPATAERIAVSDPRALAAAPAPQAPATHEPAPRPPAPHPIDMIAAAVSAAGHTTPPIAQSPPASSRLEAIASAIDAGRIEVRLSPIVGLTTHDVTHYDLSFRLKNQAGDVLDDPASEFLIAGSDVLALFDMARFVRASALADRLNARGKGGSLLSPVSGRSMTNAQFLEMFARVYEEREGISNQLVLTFSQADTEQFSASAWQALSDMHAFGFRFAIDELDHFSTDFAHLASRGFTFVKLGAPSFLNGMPARDRFVPANEICRHIAGSGMTLVVGSIDDEAVRARVFGFGVLLGQGQLFGGARAIAVDPSGVGAGQRPAAA